MLRNLCIVQNLVFQGPVLDFSLIFLKDKLSKESMSIYTYMYAFIISGIIFQVEVYGPGIEPGIRVGAPTEFTVDCSKSGPGDVTVNITSAKRKTVPVSINDNGDDTYTVTYEAQVMGPQTIVINLDDAEVPQSPIKLDIKPAADLSKIALIDFEPEAFVDCPNDFIVDTSGQHL